MAEQKDNTLSIIALVAVVAVVGMVVAFAVSTRASATATPVAAPVYKTASSAGPLPSDATTKPVNAAGDAWAGPCSDYGEQWYYDTRAGMYAIRGCKVY